MIRRILIALASTLTLSACAPEAEKPRAMPAPLAAALASLNAASDEAAAEAAANEVMGFFLQSGSPSVDALVERAGLAEIHNDLPKARALIDEAINLKPDFAEAYARRAAIAFAGKDFNSAHRDLTKAVLLEPRHFAAWAGLGAVNEALRQPAEALKAYRAALALYPKFQPARDGEARTSRIVEGVET
jgi:tetratricopeptide (TPR) repeat protein